MAQWPSRRAVLIAGPTASGKSAMALETARRIGGIIVNADAMQVYDVLALLTARPGGEALAQAPHQLYGTVPPSVRYSTGEWLRAVAGVIEASEGRPLVFAGGTGLYFEALTSGFADVPQVPAGVMAEVEAELAGLDRQQRERLIARRDPEMAARLEAADPQRVARALAVLRATGRSLASFQDAATGGLLEGYQLDRFVLNPPREVLRERIATRFGAMIEAGAVAEVEALLALGLDPALPAMKAIGVRQIADWLAGDSTREAAIAGAVTATHQYAKRQRTWFRGRMADWTWIESVPGA